MKQKKCANCHKILKEENKLNEVISPIVREIWNKGKGVLSISELNDAVKQGFQAGKQSAQQDIKEFIRLLKEEMPIKPSIFKMKMIDLIDKLAGDKLK